MVKVLKGIKSIKSIKEPQRVHCSKNQFEIQSKQFKSQYQSQITRVACLMSRLKGEKQELYRCLALFLVTLKSKNASNVSSFGVDLKKIYGNILITFQQRVLLYGCLVTAKYTQPAWMHHRKMSPYLHDANPQTIRRTAHFCSR